MAYTDPRFTQEFVLPAGTTIEVETTAAICARVGRTADAATAASTALDGIRCPTGASIESFGVTITEALTNANATHCIVALKVLSIEGASASTVATITLPKDTTEVTVSTQTNPADRTATQAVAVGARIISTDTDLPYTVPQGGVFYVEVTQAAGAAGGAFRPFVVYRQNGQPAATSASPVTKISV